MDVLGIQKFTALNASSSTHFIVAFELVFNGWSGSYFLLPFINLFIVVKNNKFHTTCPYWHLSYLAVEFALKYCKIQLNQFDFNNKKVILILLP